jgi:hypothetical protein
MIVSEEQGQRKQAPKKRKGSTEAVEQALLRDKKSYWPFALAVALFITLLGVVTHPIVFGVGLALIAAAMIGWGLEHR